MVRRSTSVTSAGVYTESLSRISLPRSLYLSNDLKSPTGKSANFRYSGNVRPSFPRNGVGLRVLCLWRVFPITDSGISIFGGMRLTSQAGPAILSAGRSGSYRVLRPHLRLPTAFMIPQRLSPLNPSPVVRALASELKPRTWCAGLRGVTDMTDFCDASGTPTRRPRRRVACVEVLKEYGVTRRTRKGCAGPLGMLYIRLRRARLSSPQRSFFSWALMGRRALR